MIALKKINTSDVRQVVPKRQWSSGTTYDYYRHDYRIKSAKVSGATNLYSASYFVMNEDYQVYICLQNGTDPDNPSGRPLWMNQHLQTSNQDLQEPVVMDIFGSTSLESNQARL